MSTRALAIEDRGGGPVCPCCGQGLSIEGPGEWTCDICQAAGREGKSVEEVRAEVVDLARGFTARFGQGSCTCDADPSCVPVASKDGTLRGVIDVEVKHKASCPRGIRRFKWAPIVDEWRPHNFVTRAVSSPPASEGR